MARLRRLLGTLKRRALGRPPQKGVRQVREEFWSLAGPLTPYVVAENGEALFLVPTEGWGRSLFVSNARKSEFVCLARACSVLERAGRLPEAGTMVDVGAHVGTTTVPALTRHGFGHVVAVEPDPENVRLLRANVELNGVADRVRVVPAALSAAGGEQVIWSPGRERGGWVRGAIVDEPTAASATIGTVTLDALVGQGVVDPSATTLLWLGQMFAEDALLASSALVEARVPIVFVFRRNQLTESSSFLRQLREAGYEQLVDLRQPSLNEPLAEWVAPLGPLDGLPTLSPRKKITDVLVF